MATRGACRTSAILLLASLILAGCNSGAPAGNPSPVPRRLSLDAAAPLSYVALGDSTVEGVGATSPARNYVSRLHERLRARFPRARTVNLGVGGATAAGVRYRQLLWALELKPDLVTLSVGPNDITTERTLADYSRDIEVILRTLADRTTAVVVVNLIPDIGVTPRFRGKEVEPLVRQRVVAFNEVLGRHARAYGAEVVDLYEASRQEVPRRPALVAADDYHPSDAGYARWAELMWAGIEARIRR
jgi:lysophospholipase L1-like esterase